MIKSEEERLKDREMEFKALVQMEKQATRLLEALDLPGERNGLSVYNSGMISINLYPSLTMEEVEEQELLGLLAERLGVEPKWRRIVSSGEVSYSLLQNTGEPILRKNYKDEVEKESVLVSLHLFPKMEGSCRIIARPTGRMVRDSKTVYFEVPELEHVIDCGE